MYLSYGSRSVTISLLVSIIALSLVALNTPALSDDRMYKFSEIMELMQNKNIKLEFVGGYRPFKVKKDGEKWVFEQQVNSERSEIVDGGNNKISATNFPPTWPINGTWKFRKDGNKCRIDHTLNVGNMTWDC